MPVRPRVRSSVRSFGFLFLSSALLLPGPVAAQDRPADWDPEAILAQESFARPPETIAEAVLAPRWRNVTLDEINATGDWLLHSVGDGPVTMDRFSLPFHDLGGQFID